MGLNPSERDAFDLVKSIFSLIYNSEGTSVSLCKVSEARKDYGAFYMEIKRI